MNGMSVGILKKSINLLLVVLKLARIDSCFLIFLTILLPVSYHTRNIMIGLTSAIPILPLTMSGFFLNDINDIPKDIVNHPNRPLSQKEIRVSTAVVVYFVLLSIALILIKRYVYGISIYYYIIFLIGFINYNYIVDYLPWIKNVYVAMIGVIPLLIAIDLSGLDLLYYWLTVSFILFIFGREILMDTLDFKGDPDSLAQRLGIQKSTKLAFGIQYLGLIGIVPLCNSVQKLILLFLLISLTFIFTKMWRRKLRQHKIIMAMKIQMLLSMLFLL